MKDKIVAIYVFIEALLKRIEHKKIVQCASYTEVITKALMACLHFKGHFEHSINFDVSHGYMLNC